MPSRQSASIKNNVLETLKKLCDSAVVVKQVRDELLLSSGVRYHAAVLLDDLNDMIARHTQLANHLGLIK